MKPRPTAAALPALALALLLAACEDEHDAVAAAADIGSFGPARLVAMPAAYHGDQEAFLAVGRARCPPGNVCRVLFFPEGVEPGMPPSDAAMARRLGSYSMNPLTSKVSLKLRCNLAAADPGNCF